MPTVLIWLPEGDNTFGHAALQTDKYYISFWPFRGKHFRFSEASITGCLHFHEHLDWVAEGNRENLRGPTSRHEIVNVTNEEINCVYEDFLRYNKIDPKEVTLEVANRKSIELCRIELPETRYSLVGDVIVDKRIQKPYSDLLYFFKRCLTSGWGNNGNIDICCDCTGRVTTYRLTRVNCPFYHKAQSCVSMCFNLIEMADRRPDVCLVEARNNGRTPFLMGPFGEENEICLQITVPNFEKHVVQKYWIEGAGERDHYDANDFEDRSRFLTYVCLNVCRMSDICFKRMFMTGPTIFFMSWLQNALNYSFLSLFGLCWIIHLIYFLLLFFVQVKLFPSLRLPKLVVYAGGFPCFAAFTIFLGSYGASSICYLLIEACRVGEIENCNGELYSSSILMIYISNCGYLILVQISEFIFGFIVDALLKRRVYHSG